MRRLQSLRREVDRIDEQLIALVAERFKLGKEIVVLKKKLGKGIRDEARERNVIDLARARAKKSGIDPVFAEDLMRLLIAQMAGAQLERVGGVKMWAQVQKAFDGHPAQLSVARVFFGYGLRVRDNGEIACGDIRIPAVQIAKEAGVDRRAVDATARVILDKKELRNIFIGLGVIEIIPRDAAKTGIISDVTRVVSKFGIRIRQAVADDPYFVAQPKLTIITDEPVGGKIIDALRKLPSVQSVIIY
jgi:predicted regulator of amino acid metabolism with ACT domain/chorismate mutase